MSAQVQPCLVVEGRRDEAIEFYRNAVGAAVAALMLFRRRPGARPPR